MRQVPVPVVQYVVGGRETHLYSQVSGQGGAQEKSPSSGEDRAISASFPRGEDH